MTTLYIDLETFSRTDLKVTGVYRYTEDPSFLILMAGWALDDDPIRVYFDKDEILAIPGLLDPEVHKVVRIVAHNAMFERVCISRLAGLPTGTYLPPDDWHDTMAVAGEQGYPMSLDALGRALGGEEKDTAGTRLINIFCKPARDGHRVLPEEKPEEWLEFTMYCVQDVVTMRDIDKNLGPWVTETERQVWISDQKINDQGMAIDLEMAKYAEAAASVNGKRDKQEITDLTGVVNPGSQPQMLKWLKESGLRLSNLRADTIEELLSGDLTDVQERVLQLRQELALVASKKFTSALASVSEDGRLRGGFRFFGAHTGRWTGRGVQPHNLPRLAFDSVAQTDAAILDLLMDADVEAADLKKLVRAMFTGPLTVVDYSSIEARIIAWEAGEQWALDAFAANRDIYVETAARMGGLTRAQGKVAVLALGYNGGVGSLRALGAAEETDATLQGWVDTWRRANPRIVKFWKTMDEAFRLGGPVGEFVTIERDGTDRHMRLPSGRAIVYHDCKWTWVETEYGPRREASFIDPKLGYGGGRARTYGGRLSENATQAIARDVMAEALVRLHGAGYSIVGHVHDEILVDGEFSISTVSGIMNVPPPWATGLPIDSAGFTCKRYRKG